MFRLNSWMRTALVSTVLLTGSAFAQPPQQNAPKVVVGAAMNEQRNGTIEQIYLDKEITVA